MKKSQFQYSLAALLLTVAAVAAVLALAFQAPIPLARTVLITAVYVLSALVATGLAYGQRAFQAFCIGAAIPLGSMLFLITSHLPGLAIMLIPESEKANFPHGLEAVYVPALVSNPGAPRLIGIGILTSIALGYLCAGFRLLIEKRDHPDS